ncbi:MAG: chitobiase/beta-hexosaminidase C-terminal domain-containing protein, partial [Candidatus Cloacimonetes bacterium]|nr:chitobiase/beta-hexosaminidase C-terminal domain-containing protein [Candidatus Cloacimonadota bacterium]
TTLTSNGWSAHSGAGTNPIIVSAPDLTYHGYNQSGIGLSAMTSGLTGEDVSKSIGTITTGSVYASFLLNIVSTANNIQDYCIHFSQTSTGFKGKVLVQRDVNDNIQFGISKSNNSTLVIPWTGYNYSLNTTYLVVFKYQFVDGDANDIASLWINPAISGAEPDPTISVSTADTQADATQLTIIALRQSSNTPLCYYDGLRVATTWEELFQSEVAPLITVNENIIPFTTILGIPSEIQSYQLTGTGLSEGILITAESPFEVRAISGDGLWHDTMTVAGSFSGSIDVRFNPSSTGTFNGMITHTSLGADNVTINVEGIASEAPAALEVYPMSLDFSTKVGEVSAPQAITLTPTNLTTPITVVTSGPYTVSGSEGGIFSTEVLVAADYNGQIWVKFTPDSITDYTNSIDFISDTVFEQTTTHSWGLDPINDYATDLFISEYIEGSSNNKALEIFNGMGHPVDLSNYRIELYSNGSSLPSYSITLGGTLADNDVYVIGNAAADPAILAVTDVTSTVTFFNGDDAVALIRVNNGMYSDIFGVIGNDPGTSWNDGGDIYTVEKTLVRMPNVISGITTNPTGTGPSAFTTLFSEWISYPQNTFSYLGTHTFSPGTQIADAPVFSPEGGIQSAPVQISLSSATPGAMIYYTNNGNEPDDSSILYTSAFEVSTTTTIKAITYAPGYTASAVVTQLYTYPVEIADIATLRSQPNDGTVYKLTGEAVITFMQSYRNQKYIQDATAAVLVDDIFTGTFGPGNITTVYNVGDGITGLTGTLTTYGGMLQFTPSLDPGIPTSSGNVVTPEVISISDFLNNFEAYEAELVRINNVSFDVMAGTTFANGLVYTLTDNGMNSLDFRTTFYDVDYIGTEIPLTNLNIVGIPNERNEAGYFTARSITDFTTGVSVPVVTIVQSMGFVDLNWDVIDGATLYRIESSDNPHTGFTLLTTTTSNSWSEFAGTTHRFYRIIAVQE